MNQRHQSGFFLMMATVILIVLSAIIGIGYVVWHRQAMSQASNYSQSSQ